MTIRGKLLKLAFTAVLWAGIFVPVAAIAGERSGPGPGEPTLADVRFATERFQDVNVALAEGYIRDPFNICDSAEMMGRPASYGAMGVHYFRPDLLGITAPPSPRVNGVGTHTDFLKPSILIYEPQSFHGVPYDSMIDDASTPIDEAHMFEPHFDRHVWIYRDNPNGVFAQFNPSVSCVNHRETHGHPGMDATH